MTEPTGNNGDSQENLPQPQVVLGNVPLSDQFNSVFGKEKEAGERFEQAILSNTASPEDVLLWWKTRDPLLETFEHDLSSLPLSERVAEAEKRSKLFLHGALTFYVDVVSRTIDAENFLEWNREISKESEKISADNADGNFLIMAKVSNKYLRKELDEGRAVFTRYDLEQLLVCAEMANAGLGFKLMKDDRQEHRKEATAMQINALDVISRFLTINEPPNSQDQDLVEVDEVKMLALRACILQNAFIESSRWFDYTDKKINKAERKEVEVFLKYFLDELSSLFFGKNSTNTICERLKRPHIKGQLHEALWYLDFIMLKYMHQDQYGGFDITPALGYANRPEIGKPQQNRAYDFYVRHMGDDGKTIGDFVQLKASPQNAQKPGSRKKYHPTIDVVEEQNFLELNPARFKNKIAAYKEILENGFQSKGMDQLDKYALPSVKEYLKNRR